jgi:ABC-type branched-subunit amino acid transport system permease subunit
VALVGGFSNLPVIVISGLVLGMLQSNLAYQAAQSWYPHWLGTGAQDLLPLIVVLVVLLVRGSPLPVRGMLTVQELPQARQPHHVGVKAAIWFAAGLIALFALGGSYRAALMTSMILAIVALSFVVITGYVGQISFVQYTLVGVSALLLAEMTTVWKIPFPLAPILAALAVTVLGVVIGLPALRVRGVNLAIVTVVMAVAIDSLYFENDSLNGGINGSQVTGPKLFGLNLEIGSGGSYPRIQFGLLCLVVLTLIALGVANLRRSRLGAQMLAVRANERSAAANGVNVARVKLVGFAIAAFIAGLGGALLGYQQTSVSGASFDPLTGILIFAICYIAGITTITGAVVAGLIGSNGLIYVIINRQINFGSYYLLITGLILIFAIIRHPEGLGGTVQEPLERLARRLFRRKPPGAAPAAGTAPVSPSAPERVV